MPREKMTTPVLHVPSRAYALLLARRWLAGFPWHVIETTAARLWFRYGDR